MLKNVGLSNYIQYIFTQTNIPSLYNLPGQKSIKFLGGILENFQASKGHSEINRPLGKRKELQNLLSNLKLVTQRGLLVLIKLNTMLANSNNTVNICSVDQGLGPAGLCYSGAPV